MTIVKADFTQTLPTGESTARFEIPTPKGAELITIEASMVYKISPKAAPLPMVKVVRNVVLK